MNLKSILKAIKLNESTISMVLGAVVIFTVGILVFNYFRDVNSGETLPVAETAENVEINVNGEKVYTVQPGDSLWIIAESQFMSGYNWIDIVAANKIPNPNFLEAGQELVIPEVPARETTVIEDVALTGSDAITGATYEVATGDSLWSIAVRAYSDGYQWVNIAEQNNIASPDIIHAGNILTIPR